jgi:hypothetical protein
MSGVLDDEKGLSKKRLLCLACCDGVTVRALTPIALVPIESGARRQAVVHVAHIRQYTIGIYVGASDLAPPPP